MELNFKMKKKNKQLDTKPKDLTTIKNGIITGNHEYKCIYISNNYTHCYMNINKAHHSSITNIIQLKNGNIASSSGTLTYYYDDDKWKTITIKIWVYPYMKVLNELIGHKGIISHIIQLSNGYIASCGYDKQILIYDLSTNNKTPIIGLKSQTLMIYSLIELSNKNIASSEKNSICIWDIITKQCLLELKKPLCSFSHLNYIPNENIIVSGTFEGVLLLWNIDSLSSSASWSVIKEYNHHRKKICFVTMLSNRRIASCSSDCTISIINSDKNNNDDDNANKENIIILKSNKESKCIVEINTFTLASGDYEGNIIIWDLNTKSRNLTIFAHSMSITSLIKTSDDKLISGSLNKDIKIWC